MHLMSGISPTEEEVDVVLSWSKDITSGCLKRRFAIRPEAFTYLRTRYRLNMMIPKVLASS